MLARKISALKYFPNCFWDSVPVSDLKRLVRIYGYVFAAIYKRRKKAGEQWTCYHQRDGKRKRQSRIPIKGKMPCR